MNTVSSCSSAQKQQIDVGGKSRKHGPSVVRWLAGQPDEIVDAFFGQATMDVQTALGQGLMQARKELTHPYARKKFDAAFDSFSARALHAAVQPGPLKHALMLGLNQADTAGCVQPKWNKCLVKRYEHQGLAAHTPCTGLNDTKEPELSAADITNVLNLLDRIQDVTPRPGLWFTVQRQSASALKNMTRQRTSRAYTTLLLALDLTIPVQKSLLGHVTVITILAYVGQLEAAHGLLPALETESMAQELKRGEGIRGLHVSQMLEKPGLFPDRFLMWLKYAALVSGSVPIYQAYTRLLTKVDPIKHHHKDVADLNERYDVLITEPVLGSEAWDIPWLTATHQTALLEHVKSMTPQRSYPGTLRGP